MRVESFPASRIWTKDIGRLSSSKHYVRALIEIDVTRARSEIAALKSQGAATVSLFSWFLACLARSAREFPEVHSLSFGRRRRVVFESVDISIIVEREHEGAKVPIPFVVRDADRMEPLQIQSLIQQTRMLPVDQRGLLSGAGQGGLLLAGVFLALPQWLRLIGWRLLLRRPDRFKTLMGTVMVSSLGGPGALRGWPIPTSIHPLSISLGSVVAKPAVDDGKVVVREFLPVTVAVDHDVVDGLPAVRFLARLSDLCGKGLSLA
jgi:pyruvate/2-oxoglutarate dehydrogenase complex dihydrolipoamide acyltransferase (E2) component